MENVESPDKSEPGQLKKYLPLILGLLAAIVMTVALLTAGVYFAFRTIRQSVLSSSLTVPVFAEQPVYNQIAYIGVDSNLWVVSPDGENPRRVTTDAHSYRFPTWSPDGRQLAFLGRDDFNNQALFVSPASRNDPQILFNDPDSAPFYLYWAPDSRSITFLTQERSELAMRQIKLNTPDTNTILGEGAPFYWVWSPNSDKMLIHVGGARIVSDDAHISVMENVEGAERVELNLAPGRFQAPVWSTDGNYFYYVATDDANSDIIYKTDANTLEQQVVTPVDGGFSFMALSPDNQHLAYLQFEQEFRPPFGKVYLTNVNGTTKKSLTDKPVASIYWSPDGAKLALLTLGRSKDGATAKASGLASPLAQDLNLRWLVYDLETDTLEPVLSFVPTIAFVQTIPYFDQYHLSLTFWSPDSRFLVVTKRDDDKLNQGGIWVVDTTSQEEPRKIGEGSLAVWSWQ